MVATSSLNRIIGDESYFEKYHTAPSKNTSETDRIETHLNYVVNLLSSQYNGNSVAMHLLAKLKEYAKHRVFPKNVGESKNRVPIFIDSFGTPCAVAYLMQCSNNYELSKEINDKFHLNYIEDIEKNEALLEWMNETGFDERALAMIQPTYDFMRNRDMLIPKTILDDMLRPQPVPTPQPKPAPAKVWSCPLCSLENEESAVTCSMCMTAKPAEKSAREKGWTCEMCTFQNEPKAKNCHLCNHQKQSEDGIKTTLINFGPEDLGFEFIGNLVTKILPGQQARDKGVRVGWLVLEINGKAQRDSTIMVTRALQSGKKKKLISILFQKTEEKVNKTEGWSFAINQPKSSTTATTTTTTTTIVKEPQTGSAGMFTFFRDYKFLLNWWTCAQEFIEASDFLQCFLDCVAKELIFLVVKYCFMIIDNEETIKRLQIDPSEAALNLSERKLDDRDIIELCSVLSENSKITSVNIQKNAFGEEGGSALGKALEQNTSIQELECQSNKIRDRGAIAIAAALSMNKTLTKLYLTNNQIDEEGASAICHALEVNSTLKAIYLGANNISAKKAKEVREILDKRDATDKKSLRMMI